MLAAVLLAPVGVLVPAGVASATTPAVSLSVSHSRITVPAAPVFSWTSSGLPRGSSLALQRQFGVDHVWKNVVAGLARNGTVTAPKLTLLGRYPYRIHVTKNGAFVANSNIRVVYAYGKVTLKKLCSVYEGYTCTAGDDGGTVAVGASVFTYQIVIGATPDGWTTDIKYKTTSCRSLSIRYAAPSWLQGVDGQTSSLRVLQGSSDPVSSSTPQGTVGSLNAKLDGGAFYLQGSTGPEGNGIDATGYAYCWSANGKR